MTFLLALLLSLPVLADTKVTDPNAVFNNLGPSQKGAAFSTSVCGQTSVAASPIPSCQVTCTDSYCTTTCDETHISNPILIHLTEANCSSKAFSLYGDDGLSILVSSTDYAAGGNTWALPFLKNLSFFFSPEPIEARLSMPMFQTVQVVLDGKLKTIMAQILVGDLVFPSGGSSLGFELWYNPSSSGPDQILMFRISNSEILYQFHGLILQNGQ